MRKSTARPERFATEFAKSGNAGGAARKAGYSENSAASIGYENMRKPEIEQRIAEIQGNALEVNDITPELIAQGMLLEALTAKSAGTRAQNWKHLALVESYERQVIKLGIAES